ncbi:carboxymuconolactone decarboxylase family protein [Altericroceibacterium spongiae]|uniref:Carboxymuconolactone decarboxylase family protein n=1 Tax=Altericroceibacterium spongiae TaxID=2320269 RepID=A0A420EII6_9SPHN|nr:carboxymuconolactone decarboxylase family protein [Altericroceibacterium spongiae]RKF20505.1 carboxymuconolactone decarboxylase family protein [Altericroceibacterium spongiae]
MRVEPIDLDKLDPANAKICEAISGSRGGIVDGPFRVWLRANPELAARMDDVSSVLRESGKLDRRLIEVAILCVARFWDARYQWAAHAPIALEAGLTQDVIDSIANSTRPASAPDDELIFYDLSISLLELRQIPDALYQRAIDRIGFGGMVELITTIGQYSLAAIVTNGFDITLLSGGPVLPERP